MRRRARLMRHADVFEHRKSTEQLVDLEGAREAAPARVLPDSTFVMSSPLRTTRPEFGMSAPVIRFTKRRLAGAVGPDERVARARARASD